MEAAIKVEDRAMPQILVPLGKLRCRGALARLLRGVVRTSIGCAVFACFGWEAVGGALAWRNK